MTEPFELPPDKQECHRKAVRLEWITIAYLSSAIIGLYLTVGSSQAGKAALFEDILSLGPPIAFLVASRVRRKEATSKQPWGYHRAVSIAYLTASVTLLLFGSLILVESVLKLFAAEHPPIGSTVIGGEQIWWGWPMIVALAWSGIPAVLIGRRKLKLAAELHDKVLYADAKMNRADWLTAAAAIVGVVGIGLGLWWMDAVAAIFISQDIARDGLRNLRRAVRDLMDARPTTYDGSGPHPVIAKLEEAARELDWVADARVRLREEGHVFAGEVHLTPITNERLAERIAEATARFSDLDWRLYDIVVVPEAGERP